MSWASRRKSVVILSGVAASLLVVALGFFYFYPKPSCTDGKQNQEELGIDCGGSCQLICKERTLPLSVAWARPVIVTPGVSSAVAYVTNPNASLGAERVPYIFRLYDDKNLLIAERSGVTNIIPNQSFPIFEGGITAGNRVPVRAYFEFTTVPFWQKRAAPLLSVKNTNLDDPLSSPRLSAILHNDGLIAVGPIEVIAVLYDNSGNAMAASETLVDSIPKDGQAKLVFTWPQPFSQVPTRTEIYPKALLPL